MLKINRNIFWSNIFFDLVINHNITNVVISPGSRSTPLTLVAATNKSLKSFPIVDERAASFFALGLSKQTNLASIIITTSGTAVAETYPAIIEAYQSRIPLIVCTADRPSNLRNTGANQTIFQKDIFRNHIRFSYDIPLFEISKSHIKHFIGIISKGLETCMSLDVGPVHFNFQFDKPFEPDSYTDNISLDIIKYTAEQIENFDFIKNEEQSAQKSSVTNEIQLKRKYSLLKTKSPIVITIGSGTFDNEFVKQLDKFSIKNNIPIIADICSGLRSNKKQLKNLIYNYDSLFRLNSIQSYFKPATVIHFGRNITSAALEDYLVKIKPRRIIVNQYGDRFDTTKTGTIIKSSPLDYINLLSKNDIIKNDKSTLQQLLDLDTKVELIKKQIFNNTFSEVDIVNIIAETVPAKTNLFISNSLPIRDFDFFVSRINQSIKIFANRGASGIDGIISTAAGISASNRTPTYLVIGDVSFFYDITSLQIVKKFRLPLKLIVINNHGGGIFEYLPVSKYKKILRDFFLTPISLDFSKLSEAFGIDYHYADRRDDFINKINYINKIKSSVILEVEINSLVTRSLKSIFRKQVESQLIKNSK
jgi:2-succinyl-5-enolpyruvyl-6-hydroxy-3-cyclohexene-1-carboxylate synthase